MSDLGRTGTGDELRKAAKDAEARILEGIAHPNGRAIRECALDTLTFTLARAQAETIDRLERIEASVIIAARKT